MPASISFVLKCTESLGVVQCCAVGVQHNFGKGHVHLSHVATLRCLNRALELYSVSCWSLNVAAE